MAKNIKETITWDRLSEIATELLYGMFEAEPYEAVEFCRERDLSETEIEYLVADCHKKYFETEEPEFTCEDCPYHYYDEDEEYATCHHNGEDTAPCEYEKLNEFYDEKFYDEYL